MPRSSPSLSWPTLTMASLPSAAMPNCQPPAFASPVSNSVNAASIVRQTPTRKGIFSVLERGMPQPLPAPRRDRGPLAEVLPADDEMYLLRRLHGLPGSMTGRSRGSVSSRLSSFGAGADER
jgi:hypothetical protein